MQKHGTKDRYLSSEVIRMSDGKAPQKTKRAREPSVLLAAQMSSTCRVVEFVEPQEVVEQRNFEEQLVNLTQITTKPAEAKTPL